MDGFQKRTLKKRKAILDTSLSLFNEYGYKNVTISQIARQAQVSLETIYNYFESKENLKNELLRQIIDEYCSFVGNIIDGDATAYEKMEKLILSKVDFTKQFSPRFLKEELDEFNHLDLFGSEEKQRLLRNIVLQEIEQGKKEQMITVEASDDALIAYFNVFQYYITHNLSSTLQISNNLPLMQEIWSLFMNGLKK